MIDKQVLRSEPTNRPTDRPGLSVFPLFASFDFLKYTKIERIGRALFDKLVWRRKAENKKSLNMETEMILTLSSKGGKVSVEGASNAAYTAGGRVNQP